MKKIILVIGIIATLGIITFAGSAYYFVNYVAKPEQVRKIIIENIEKQLPNSKVELGEIRYSLFPSIKLNMKDLRIVTKAKHSPLANFSQAVVHIPILNVLKGGGAFLLKVDSPEIFILQEGKKTNWEQALGTQKKRSSKTSKHSSINTENTDKKNKVIIPSFLMQSFLDVKVVNAKFNYNLGKQKKGSFYIEKLLFKHLGFLEKSAFEIVSHVDIDNDGVKLKVHPILIGTLNLNEILFKQKIKIPMELKLLNLTLPTLGYRFPLLTNHITVQMDKVKNLSGNFSFKMLDKNRISFNYLVAKQTIKLSKLKVQIALADMMNIFHVVQPELEVAKSLLYIDGDLVIKGQNTIIPSLKMGVTSPIRYSYNKQNVIINPTITLSKKLLQGRVKIDAFQGKGVLATKLLLPKNLMNIKFSNLAPLNVNLKLLNMKFSEHFIQGLLFAKKKIVAKKSEPISGTSVKQVKSQPLFLPNLKFSMNIENMKIGQAGLQSTCKFLLFDRKYNLQQCEFMIDQGKVSITSQGIVRSATQFTNHSKINIDQLSISSLSAFFPPILGEISGTVNSSAKIQATVGKKISFSTNYKVVAINGHIAKLNLGKYVKQYQQKVSFLKKISAKKVDLSDSFKQLVVNGTATDKNIKIDKFLFAGIKNKVEIKGHANIFPFVGIKGNSIVEGTWLDRAGLISRQLKKQTGKNKLPFRLAGQNLDLKPQYDYTLKKVGTNYLKKQGQKQVSKFLQKKLGSKANKILKNKKVKKLLQGLFD